MSEQNTATFALDVELKDIADEPVSNSTRRMKLKMQQQEQEEGDNFIPSGEIWNKYGNIFKPDTHYEQYKTLPVGVYTVHSSRAGYFLKRMYDKYEFDYKIYGLEQNLINRFIKTFKHTTGNIGALFNGLKGTGKTVTAKQLCNHLNLPVILITFNDGNVHNFVNNINQDVIIFVDEYEKIYEKDADMLSIMDGATNSDYRRIFLLTTNTLYLNDNLLQRPGRIRYLKTFKDLTPEIIEEVVEDCLIHKHLKKEVIHFISGLESITIDIAKAVIQEVNIHNEDPEVFSDIFNVKKLSGKYDITIYNEDEQDIAKRYVPLFKSVVTNFKGYDQFEHAEDGFSLNINNVGYIHLANSVDGKRFTATINSENLHNKFKELIRQKLVEVGAISKTKKKFNVEILLEVESAWVYNRNYRGYEYDF